jgi:high-affinity iron transporter
MHPSLRGAAASLAVPVVLALALGGCGGSAKSAPAAPRGTTALQQTTTLAPQVATALGAGLERVASDMRQVAASRDGARLPAAVRRSQREVAAMRAVVHAQAATGGSAPSVLTVELQDLREVLDLGALSGLTPAAARLVGIEAERLATDLRARIDRREPGLAAAGPHRGAPAAPTAFRAASAISHDLFRARWALAVGRPLEAAAAVASADRAARALAPAPASLRSAIDRAARAVRANDPVALAAARGSATAAIAAVALTRTVRATAAGRGDEAARWVVVRDLGPTTAPAGVRDDAARAVAALRAGQLTTSAATLAVRRDELDGLQRRTLAQVQQAGVAAYRRDSAARAEAAAVALGYWRILAPGYTSHFGAAAAQTVHRAFAGLTTLPADPAGWDIDAHLTVASSALGNYTAAPATSSDKAQRARQLVSLTSLTTSQLCDRNAPARKKGGDVGEGAVGPTAIVRLIDDLRPGLASADRARLDAVAREVAGLPKAAGILGEEGSPPPATVPHEAERVCDRVRDGVAAVFPAQWRRLGGDEDLDRVEDKLARMEAAAKAGRWGEAEQARRDAYAIFELGPEPRLRAFAPDLATRIEGLFWAAAPDGPNLVDVLSRHTPAAVVHARRQATVAALERARVTLDRSHSGAAVVANGAIVVFREGLEAALILAALAATFAAGGGAWRRPLVIGMLAALPATVATWFATTAAVRSLSGVGLALEAVLDVVALAVLGVILAWFFQRFCWTRFVAKQHARHRRVLALGGTVGPAIALGLLGFTALYREGLETVVYLQALRVDAPTSTVLEGVVVGLAITAVLAVLMLRIRRRLPYRAIVVATAVMIAVLTVVLTGQTARAAQAAGWLGVSPLDITLPNWTGQWLGLYPAVETVIAQVLAAVGVVVLGWVVRSRRERRISRQVARARARKASAAA